MLGDGGIECLSGNVYRLQLTQQVMRLWEEENVLVFPLGQLNKSENGNNTLARVANELRRMKAAKRNERGLFALAELGKRVGGGAVWEASDLAREGVTVRQENRLRA